MAALEVLTFTDNYIGADHYATVACTESAGSYYATDFEIFNTGLTQAQETDNFNNETGKYYLFFNKYISYLFETIF